VLPYGNHTSPKRTEREALPPSAKLFWRRSAELDVVTIGIDEEYLPCAVGPKARPMERRARLLQVRFPGVQVVRQQGEVVAAIMRLDRLGAAADQVQLLPLAEAEPCAGKAERRPRDPLQPQHLGIKAAASLHVGDVQGHVIELAKVHGPLLVVLVLVLVLVLRTQLTLIEHENEHEHENREI